MPPSTDSTFQGRRRVPIAARFWAVLAMIFSFGVVVAVLALSSLSAMRMSETDVRRTLDAVAHDRAVRAQVAALHTALLAAVATGEGEAQVQQAFAELRAALGDRRTVTGPLRALASDWETGAIVPDDVDMSEARVAVAEALAPLEGATDAAAEADVHAAVVAQRGADDSYTGAVTSVVFIFILALALMVALRLWLVRSLAPRLRTYSRFAAVVAAGAPAGRLSPRGNDELADLGRSLDAMVERHERELHDQRAHAQLLDALQTAGSAPEAHDLIRRHLERSIPEGEVTLLLDDEPQSCLAVQHGRTHEGAPDALLVCRTCGKRGGATTCSPLLMGGEVVGSVLTRHPDPLTEAQARVVQATVVQATPVLVNLRNLAHAREHAATDALTGLPNRRSAVDELRRLSAQARRADAPLAVAVLDLDRFKQVNDTYGHDAGDEVLVASGGAMRAAVRESDFVARYGGEEFLVLLPDTDLAGAIEAAEKIRLAIARLTVPSVPRALSVSIGVAILDAGTADPEAVVREADRALYAAKEGGRDRVVAAASSLITRT